MKVVHCKKEQYDVYVGLLSKWGNPFTIGQQSMKMYHGPRLHEALKCLEAGYPENGPNVISTKLWQK